ncbi:MULTISPECIES: SURF1 family protein [Thalassospira]|uniref:SURF1-like protein n=1 Tax=Thalassospira aquimaris TaxID=3037796 RepID=A0ABT6GDQ8_9PROT|nr:MULTISPECIES: SURF1 family protein [Thalassospira]MDG4720221.1 SURF1 family protein [Thalassospira sp. FZY0004]
MTENRISQPHIPRTSPRTGPSMTTRIVVLALAAILFSGFFALGYWQIERRAWKLDLIERIDARVHGDAVEAPTRADWDNVSRTRDEYRKVHVTGTYRNDLESQVYTATDYGAGYWVLTPLVRGDGTIVMINRGFVPTERREPASRTDGMVEGEVTVTGLLRMDEPVGTFMRDNVPSEERWYSRDVRAMATKRGLNADDVAPYFIDGSGAQNTAKLPIGGLTKISFPNNHMSYALTWFGMAALTLVAAWVVLRPRRRKAVGDDTDD